MIEPLPEHPDDGRRRLRVADERRDDPLDPSFARRHGGRWNPPGSFPALCLNEDVATARSRISRMLSGWPADPEDLDAPFVLVTVTLPRGQIVADAVTNEGLEGLGLPDSYPIDATGAPIPHSVCMPIGAPVKLCGLRGVPARSAATENGAGRELAWFPARTSSKARRVEPDRPFADWW